MSQRADCRLVVRIGLPRYFPTTPKMPATVIKRRNVPTGRESNPMKKVHKASPTDTSTSVVRSPFRLMIPFVLLLMLWVAGAAFPSQRTWGFSMAAYMSPYLASLFILLCVLTLIPSIATRVGSLAGHVASRFVGKGGESRITAGAVAVVAGLLFFFLAIPFSFLGDSFLYLAEVIRAADSGQVDLLRYNSLFSSLIFLFAGSKLMTLFGFVEVARVFWLIAAVCGAVYVYILLRGVSAVADDVLEAVMFVGLMLGLGGIVLFFGYVEYYAPLFVATLAYAVALHRATARGESLVRPALLLVLCIAFHFLALFYIPAFLLAVYLRRRKGETEGVSSAAYFRMVLAGLIVFSGIVSAVVLLGLEPLYASLIPFSMQSWTGTYTMFSSYHLLDLLNEIVLVAAIPTALLIGLSITGRLRYPAHTAPAQVFLVFALSLVMLAVVHFPFYGMARDWDIYAPLGIATAFYLFTVLRSVRFDTASRRYLAGLIVFWSLVFQVLWLSANIHEASALRRYTDILQLDEEHVHPDFAQYGYLNLKKYYQHKGELENSARAFRRMIELRGYPWDINGFVNFVNALDEPLKVREDIDAVRGLLMQKSRDSLLTSVRQGVDNRDSAEYVIDQLFYFKPEINASILTRENIQMFIESNPDLPQCRLLIYSIEPPTGRSDLYRYRSAYEESISTRQGNAPLLSVHFRSGITYVIGQMYQQLRQLDSALIWYERSYTLDSRRAKFLDDYGLLLSAANEPRRAARLFEEALEVDPSFADAYLHLGMYDLQILGDQASATQLLEQYLERSSDQETKKKVEDLLHRMARSVGP